MLGGCPTMSQLLAWSVPRPQQTFTSITYRLKKGLGPQENTPATMFHDNRVLECMNKTDTFGK